MASTAAFFTAPNIGAALLGNAETNLQVPTTTSTLITAAANGTQVYEVVIEAAASGTTTTTVAGEVYLFLHDGTTYHLFDVLPVTVVAGTTTLAPFRVNRVYTNLILKTGWSLRASQSIAGNASLLKAIAFGLDA